MSQPPSVRITSDSQWERTLREDPLESSVGSPPRSPEAARPGKPLVLPPALDMGTLKADDLDFDIETEVARLRAAEAHTLAIRGAPRH